MQRRFTERRVNANVELCFVIASAMETVPFLTLALARHAPQTSCIKSPV